MGYERDPDRVTRGVGAIASLDHASPGRYRRRVAEQRATARRDRAMSAVSMGALGAVKTDPIPGGRGGAIPTPAPTMPKAGTGWFKVLNETAKRVKAAGAIKIVNRDHAPAATPASWASAPPAAPAGSVVVVAPPLAPTSPTDPPPPTTTSSGAPIRTAPNYGGGGGAAALPAKVTTPTVVLDPLAPPSDDTTVVSAPDNTIRNVALIGGGLLAAFLIFRRPS